MHCYQFIHEFVWTVKSRTFHIRTHLCDVSILVIGLGEHVNVYGGWQLLLHGDKVLQNQWLMKPSSNNLGIHQF